MNIENALKIQGFTNPAELEWLALQASSRKVIAEVGSWKGRGTRAMADNLPEGGVIYAVDTWRGTPADTHMRELEGKPEDWLFNQFIANIGENLLHRVTKVVENGVEYPHDIYTVRPLREESVTAAHYLGEDCYHVKFDMVFIDAAHDYEAVKNDILAWRKYLAPGGLLCGHDYEKGRGGVVQAVNECVAHPKRIGVGTIWIAE